MVSRHVRPLWALAAMMLAMGAATQSTTPAKSDLSYTSITTETLERDKKAGMPANVANDPRNRLMNRQLIKPVNPAIGAALSTDTQLQYLRTGRPALIVGTFVGYDRATSTVLVKVDPKLSRFPHAMEVASKQYRVPTDRVFARELRPERRFRLDDETHVVDDTAPLDPQPGRLARPRPNMKLEAIKPGDKVTVTYRIQVKADAIPRAYNLSKVDPARTYFSADIDPTRGPVPRRQAPQTSGTLSRLPQNPKRPVSSARK